MFKNRIKIDTMTVPKVINCHSKVMSATWKLNPKPFCFICFMASFLEVFCSFLLL